MTGKKMRGRVVGALTTAMAVSVLAGACTHAVQVRGNMPDEEEIAAIAPGIDTRNDVAGQLGSPSTVSPWNSDTWYYIGQKTQRVAFMKPQVLDSSVLEISFDPQGMVSKTKLYTIHDGKEIDPVDRETPTEGRDLTILQQLLGNLGRFSGEQFNDEDGL